MDSVNSQHMRAPLSITPEQATRLIAPLVPDAGPVNRVRVLTGGVVNQVMELRTASKPGRLVLKLNTPDSAPLLRQQHETLAWYRQNTDFPVPRPIGWFNTSELPPEAQEAQEAQQAPEPPKAQKPSEESVENPREGRRNTLSGNDYDENEHLAVAGLLLEYVPGNHLAAANLSGPGSARLQVKLAEHLTALHGRTAQAYGSALEEPRYERWTNVFAPMLAYELNAVADMLPSRARWVATEVLDHLDGWLPEQNQPRLIHGDLWATNIIVDDRHPDRPDISAFIDCGATYADVEYELAYLSLFQTIDKNFMNAYGHPPARGFGRRCYVYWLNAMLLHIRLHGDQYVGRLVAITETLRKLR